MVKKHALSACVVPPSPHFCKSHQHVLSGCTPWLTHCCPPPPPWALSRSCSPSPTAVPSRDGPWRSWSPLRGMSCWPLMVRASFRAPVKTGVHVLTEQLRPHHLRFKIPQGPQRQVQSPAGAPRVGVRVRGARLLVRTGQRMGSRISKCAK